MFDNSNTETLTTGCALHITINPSRCSLLYCPCRRACRVAISSIAEVRKTNVIDTSLKPMVAAITTKIDI